LYGSLEIFSTKYIYVFVERKVVCGIGTDQNFLTKPINMDFVIELANTRAERAITNDYFLLYIKLVNKIILKMIK